MLFAVCVNGPLWTDFQINGMELIGFRALECRRLAKFYKFLNSSNRINKSD